MKGNNKKDKNKKGKNKKIGENKKTVKNKKAFVLFPLLIVLIAMLVFSIAFVGLILKSREKIKSLKSLDDVIDYKWKIKNLEKFLDISYNLAYNTALNNFFKDLECNALTDNKKYYFELKECKIDKDSHKTLFLSKLKESFEVYLKDYNYTCNYGAKLSCEIIFNKTFNLNFMNVSIEKKVYFNKEVDFDYLDKVEIARLKLLEELSKELSKGSSFSTADMKKINGLEVVANIGQRTYITLFTEKRF